VSSLLDISNLHASYGAVQALRGVSLEVRQGEIVSLLGSNGAGKSTLLRSIIRMAPNGRGEIRFNGKSIERIKTDEIVKSGIALVPEGRGILATMSVEENLDLGAFHQNAGWREMLTEIFELFPIVKERWKQNAGTLSGGEQQMVAIARALVSKPKLLLLDEPSLGLAPKIIQSIFALIKTIQSRGMSILLVEQNVHMAMKVADRAYVLQTGRVVLSGTGAEMRDRLEETQQAYLGG